MGILRAWAGRSLGPPLLVERHQRQEPFVHVLHNRLVAPGVKLTDGCGNHVEAAPAARYLEQVNGPVEHGGGLVEVALADVGEGQIPQDDRLRLVTVLDCQLRAIAAEFERPGQGGRQGLAACLLR